MKKFESILREYIEDNMGYIMNPNNIEIVYDRYVLACCEYPGYHAINENIILEILSDNDTLNKFIRRFGITSVNDLAAIDSHSLYNLYLKGEADVICMFDGYLPDVLYFRKKGGNVYARDEENNQKLVDMDLQRPEDYIAYTRRHFPAAIV